MTLPAWTVSLLAILPVDGERISRLQAIRQGLTNERPPQVDLFWLFVAGLALVGTLWFMGLIAKRAERRRRPIDRPRDFLAEALDKLQLTRAEADDVRVLVSHCRLNEPASLLLTPANFEHALRTANRNGLDAARRERLCALAELLFGERIPPEKVL